MSSYSEIGEALDNLLTGLLWISAISVPLAIWKAVDLVLLVIHHVSWK